MRPYTRPMIGALLLACLLLTACQSASGAATEDEIQPITVEHLEGQDPTRETLLEEAAKRLDIQTATVSAAEVQGAQRTTIPYAAVLYDTEGATWVYVNTKPLTYVRTPIVVDYIEGDTAFLTDGPPAGTAVVTVGAPELYGAELEFEEE